MKLLSTNIFMGYTFFRFDEPVLTKRIKGIKIDNIFYDVEYPYDMPYTLMIKDTIDTKGKEVNLIV